MKTYQQSRRIARRTGIILGLMVLFLSCAMMGGADPAAQVDAARERARHSPHPFWASNTIMADLGDLA